MTKASLNPGYPFGLLFHHFHSVGSIQVVGSISAEEFADRLELVGLDRIIRSEEWKERALGGTLSGDEVFISFDDGLACQYDVAHAVLKQYDLTAFWFIYSAPLSGEKDKLEIYRYFQSGKFDQIVDFYDAFFRFVQKSNVYPQIEQALDQADIEGYLIHAPFYSHSDRRFRFARDQLFGSQLYHQVMHNMMREYDFDSGNISKDIWLSASKISHLASEGHSIGLHSHTHPTNLANLSVEQQMQEFSKNQNMLEQITGAPVRIASFPCNSYNEDTLWVLGQLGVELCFRADSRGPPRSMLEWPRLNHSLLSWNYTS